MIDALFDPAYIWCHNSPVWTKEAPSCQAAIKKKFQKDKIVLKKAWTWDPNQSHQDGGVQLQVLHKQTKKINIS